MSIESKDREMSKLQQDAPVATLPTLPNSEAVSTEMSMVAKTLKNKDEVKPFFLYPRDGLYGLL